MMKHLVIVFTVLAMASVANAALYISVDGVENPYDSSINLTPNQTAVIDITGDGQTPTPQALYLFAIGQGTIAGGTVLYGNLSAIGPGEQLDIDWIVDSGYAAPSSVIWMELADSTMPPNTPPLLGKLVDEIVYTCTGQPDDVTLYLTDLDDPTIVHDTQVIHQVPEPITFALLGLGGLFLRRRK
jgi:hypothetical protein